MLEIATRFVLVHSSHDVDATRHADRRRRSGNRISCPLLPVDPCLGFGHRRTVAAIEYALTSAGRNTMFGRSSELDTGCGFISI